MKWLIALLAVCGLFTILLAQVAVTPQAGPMKSTATVTFGTSKSTDTTSVSGATSADKYLFTHTSLYKSVRPCWVEAKTGTVIVHCDSSETAETGDLLRVK